MSDEGGLGEAQPLEEEYRFGDLKGPSEKVQEELERTQELGSLGTGWVGG